jgi:hypothetical protein
LVVGWVQALAAVSVVGEVPLQAPPERVPGQQCALASLVCLLREGSCC